MNASIARVTVSASIRTTVDLFLGPAAIVLALLFSLLVPVRQAQAQTLTANGLSWGVAKSGPDTASVQSGALAIASTFALTAAWYGVTRVTPVGRIVTTTAAAAGPIAAAMLRQAAAKGPLTGAMLALAVALGSDAAYDASSNAFRSPLAAPAVPFGTPGFRWGTTAAAGSFDTAEAACIAGQALTGFTFDGSFDVAGRHCRGTKDGVPGVFGTLSQASGSAGCISGFVFDAASGACKSTMTGPASDAQLASAAQSSAALAKVWDAASDSDKDQLIGGGIPGAPTFPNGNNVQFPSQTTTGAGTDAQGRPFNGTVTTVPGFTIGQNTGADSKQNPVTVTPSQTRTWSGTDSAGNPVSQTATVAFPPQNVAIPNQQQAVSPASAPTVDTCGLPGKPKCLIDETGTPAQSAVDALTGSANSALDAVKQGRLDQLTQAQGGGTGMNGGGDFKVHLPSFLPSGGTCQPIQYMDFKGTPAFVDLCEKLGFLRNSFTWLWPALAMIYVYKRAAEAEV